MSAKSPTGPNNKPETPGPPKTVIQKLIRMGVPAAVLAGKKSGPETARAVLEHLRKTAKGGRSNG